MSETTQLPLCYLSKDLRKLESDAQAASPQPSLMERAGQAAAEWFSQHVSADQRTLILAGPGNNGGDAIVMSRLLQQQGYPVDTVLLGDPARLPADASDAWQKYQQAGYSASHVLPAPQAWDWIVDGLFGIGVSRPLDGLYADAVNYTNEYANHVFALDIPSGLAADTGVATGPTVIADYTLTFLGWKPGLITADGKDFAGHVRLADLGIAPGTSHGRLLNAMPATLAPRKYNSHKGSHGCVGVLGGDRGMEGAVLLAARAALKLGAGKVFASALGDVPLDMNTLQLMRAAPATLLEMELDVLAVGPGMGDSAMAVELLEKALALNMPLVLDADALTLLGLHAHLQTATVLREAPTILTPHPLEAARLLPTSIETLQADRITHALEIAERYQATVVLKGSGSVIARPDGHWWINTSGNPGMAVAGMGDVLTGIIAALLAQGMDATDATAAAVWLHGAAGDHVVTEQGGMIGVGSEELMAVARSRMNMAIYN
ncbi:bifunctional ADP-dependent NAD(P)H-hydrate dehydratase/NAD(P)H-hydrate epimerase [Leeia oryzae]|uniref:bifunctional ADP-dependent NAD(P)H-hydrate dehydratase/NAD(P)H-hydrate epimerase n=1 Tax=Leeia oryzae TaxID=356662 RepID=UPI00036956CB|nr:bifunctional ADP-dependent NAD(P)H-hydrate dehydratase/NAD(P)H-hydrate epimerase [Leeia oryzae]